MDVAPGAMPCGRGRTGGLPKNDTPACVQSLRFASSQTLLLKALTDGLEHAKLWQLLEGDGTMLYPGSCRRHYWP